MRSVLTVAALVCLTGCASTSLPIDQAKRAPPERITWKAPAAGDTATVVVARDAGLAGSALWVYVSIDGIAAAQLDPGESANLTVGAGAHTVLAEARGALNQSGIKPLSADVQLASGSIAVFRFGFNDTGNMSMWRDAAAGP